MLIRVKTLAGLAGLPADRTALSMWLRRNSIETQRVNVQGGMAEAVLLSDLPAPVRAAFLDREAAEFGLDPGQYDEAAHARLEDATPRMRARAEADARLVTFIKARVQAGLSQEDAFKAARAKFGAKGTSRATLLRNMKAVKGVDPVNFAPALLTDHCRVGGRKGPAAGESPEAWAYFLHRISAAHPDWPLAAAYDEVERIKAQMGWHWPSRATIYNRWNALPQSVQLTLRFGAAKAAEMMRQGGQVMRDDIEIRLVFTLTPEEAARFHGRGVLMITPIQEAEIATLKAMFLGLRDFLAFNARNLATLNESLESGKITGARAAVARMLEPSRQAVQTHDAMLQILGRSKFVGGDEYGSVTEGTVQ